MKNICAVMLLTVGMLPLQQTVAASDGTKRMAVVGAAGVVALGYVGMRNFFSPTKQPDHLVDIPAAAGGVKTSVAVSKDRHVEQLEFLVGNGEIKKDGYEGKNFTELVTMLINENCVLRARLDLLDSFIGDGRFQDDRFKVMNLTEILRVLLQKDSAQVEAVAAEQHTALTDEVAILREKIAALDSTVSKQASAIVAQNQDIDDCIEALREARGESYLNEEAPLKEEEAELTGEAGDNSGKRLSQAVDSDEECISSQVVAVAVGSGSDSESDEQ